MRAVEPITRAKIDELVHFLPNFEQPMRDFIMRWEGGHLDASGNNVTTAYPVYTADINLFFHYVCQPCWCDYDYAQKRAEDWLNDDAFIAQASLDEIRTMLTHAARGERFCAGYWGGLLKRCRVQAILRRLVELRHGAS